MFSIYAFRAVDRPLECQQFAQGHAEVLTSYGITKLTNLDYSWMDDPNVYVIAVKITALMKWLAAVDFISLILVPEPPCYWRVPLLP